MKTKREIIRELIDYVDENYRKTSLSELMDMTWNEWKAADLPFAMLDHIRIEVLSNYIINCSVYHVVPRTGYDEKMEGEP